MRIEVSGKHLDITDPIRDYATTKADKLTRFYNGVMEITYVLDQQPHGEFFAELRVDVVKHDAFVAKSTGPDIYACIDMCIDKMTRQLTDFKEKLRSNNR